MLRSLVFVFLIFFSILNAFAQSDLNSVSLTDEERDWISRHPSVTASSNTGYAPIDFMSAGNPAGLSIDYVKLLASKVGLNVEFVNYGTWSKMLEMAKANQLDIVHTLSKNGDREKYFIFSDPYVRIPVALYGRKGSQRIKNVNDLKNKKIGVIKNHIVTATYETKLPDLEYIVFDNNTEALKALSDGEIDIYPGDVTAIESNISQNNIQGLEIVGDDPIIGKEGIDQRIAVSRENPKLMSILKKAMAGVSDEEYKAISNKWLGNMPIQNDIRLTEEERDWITSHPVITATNETDYAPFDFVEEGVATGYSIDYLNLIANKLGLKINFITGNSWAEQIDQAKSQEIDIVHSIRKTADREKYLNFTSSYISIPTVYYGKTGAAPITNLNDLKGKKIGAIEGWNSTEIYKKNYPQLDLVYFNSVREALVGLSIGKIDVFSNNLFVTDYLIHKHFIPHIEVIGNEFLPEIGQETFLHIGTRKDWPILRNILQKAIDDVTPEDVSEISTKWSTISSEKDTLMLSREEKEWLAKNNSIKVAAIDNIMPYEIIDHQDNVSGLVADYMQLISEKLNLHLEWIKNETFSDALNKTKADEIQLIPIITPTEQRKSELLLTDSYASGVHMIFARNDANLVSNIDELANKRFIQIRGYGINEWLNKKFPNIIKTEVESVAEALKKISSGEADILVDDIITTSYYIEKNGYTNIKIIGATDYIAAAAMGINKKYPLLASSIQKALSSITQLEKAEISNKWHVIKSETVVDYTVLFKYLGVALLIIVFILYWNQKLRSEIHKNTILQNQLQEEKENVTEALKKVNEQYLELEYQASTIEESAVKNIELLEDLAIAEDTVQQKNKFLKDIMDNTGHGIAVFDKFLRLAAWNNTFQELLGLNNCEYKEEMPLKEFFEMNLKNGSKYDLNIDEYIEQLKLRIKNREECNEFTWDRTHNNKIINTSQRIMDDGSVINTYRDVTAERNEERIIQEMAMQDSLTGLANRRAFDAHMEKRTNNFNANKNPFILVYMDLDNFKSVNDTQGHNAGDAVLSKVSQIMKEHVRDNDKLFRFGGDEFAIIMNETDNKQIAEERLKAIISEVKKIKKLESYEINVGASAGMACFPSDTSDKINLMELADSALYKAKENGKGQVFFHI
ncbi:MAG: transporter substrate-binding domain-containing protein [Kordiimonadaceae bacterium]|nr:transporter substrate-binding domain-containing protein [Kordiimonadaceae bacterium]